MKKKFFYFIMMLMCMCHFMSCSDDSEQTYSCDAQVNSWVKANTASIQGMTREQWKGLSTRVNVAVYRAFPPNQRYRFWKEKIGEVKMLKWSKAEMEHIERLELFIDENKAFFDKRIDEDLDVIEVFAYQWCDYAQKHLCWTNDVIYSIVGTGAEVKDTKGTIITRKRSLKASAQLSIKAEPGPITLNCNCNLTSLVSCMGNPSGETICNNARKCETLDRGCGFLWLSSCDGRCGSL